MLRTIQSNRIRPRILAYSIDSSTSPATIGIGAADISSSVRNGTGDVSLVYRQPFRRAGIVVGSIGSNITDGGYFTTDTVPTTTTAKCLSLNGGAGGVNGLSDALILGWDSDNTDLPILQNVDAAIDNCVLIGMAVTGSSGALTIGTKDATSVRNGTGDYTLTFRKGFGRTPIIAVCCQNAATHVAKVAAKSAESVQIKTFTAAAAAADCNFHIFVFGTLSRQETGRTFSPVMTSQRKPRLIGLRIINTAGTPSASIGSNDVAVTDGGTGNYTLTFARPFKRTPIVVATASASLMCSTIAVSSTAVNVFVADSAGSASDGGCDLLILGFDDASEY